MNKPLLTYEEFCRGSSYIDVLKLTPEDIKVLDEAQRESDLRRDRNWSKLGNRVIGAEV